MSQQGFQRWSPLAGPAFVVTMIIGFVIAGSSPDPDASDHKIASYLAKSSSYHRNLVSFFLVLVAGLALVVFYTGLRERLAAADGGHGALSTLAFGAGVLSAGLQMLALFAFVSPVIAAHDAASGKGVLDPSVYRLGQDFGYQAWVGSVVIGALIVWATAAVALRTGILPRWFARVSILVGVINLFAILFIPIQIFGVWILVTGVLLFRAPAAAVPAPPAAEPRPAPVA
jgi:hypothetical protein